MVSDINKLIISIIKFSLLMIVVAIIAGVVFEETTKFLHSGTIEFGTIRDVKFDISLLHGMTIVIGSLIPLALAFVTYFLRETFSEQYTIHGMFKSFNIYRIGAILSLTLFAYKGLAIVYLFKADPSIDLNIINQSLFWGNKTIRVLIYASTHTLMAVGLFWYLLILNKQLSKMRQSL